MILKKIVFVFRRKSFLQNDPIISSMVINANDFPVPNNNSINTESKTINIYEPIQGDRFNFPHQNRRIFGQMSIQFSLTDAFSDIQPQNCKKTNKYGIEKMHKGECYAKVGAYSNADENQNGSNALFIDPDFN